MTVNPLPFPFDSVSKRVQSLNLLRHCRHFQLLKEIKVWLNKLVTVCRGSASVTF